MREGNAGSLVPGPPPRPRGAGSSQEGGEISATVPARPPVKSLPKSTRAAFVSGQWVS